MIKYSYLLLVLLFIGLAACGQAQTVVVQSTPVPESSPTVNRAFAIVPEASPTINPTFTPTAAPAYAMNARLARTINFGNALEAPKEGDWGVTLQADFFQVIKAQGFTAVRVPIRWSAHADDKAPYTIDPAFFQRIDWVVDQAQQNGLAVILDVHHYYEIFQDPQGNHDRFLALWQQIAVHYKDAPLDSVVFELLNEPQGNAMTADVWNSLLADALAKVRETNPDRTVILGPVSYNSVDMLDRLKLPPDDQNIIVTFHYYRPFEFTHQGTEFTPGSDKWLGTKWGSAQDKASVSNDFDKALRWSQANHRPILLGEFGAYHTVDEVSRLAWTSYLARQAEARGFSWGYWDFASGFGIYDLSTKKVNTALVQALIPAP